MTLTGIWDGLSSSVVHDGASVGDTRIERSEWHLDHDGTSVRGYVLVAMTMLSGDGRPFICNRRPDFSFVVRLALSGRAAAGLVDLEETGELTLDDEGCQGPPRTLMRYRGEIRNNRLVLTAAGRRHTLYRRSPEATEAAGDPTSAGPIDDATARPVALPPVAGSDAPAANVAGVWVWENHAVVAGGDEKHEREEWHVTQEGASLGGYYDRLVQQVSTDGQPYRCSMGFDFRIATRFRISGQVRGPDVVIREEAFEIIEASPCDNGQRRLDEYRGRVGADDITLTWDRGSQTLRRPRPAVPTQRF